MLIAKYLPRTLFIIPIHYPIEQAMSTLTAYSYRSHRSLVKRDFSHSLKIDFIVYRLITQGMGTDMEPKEKGFTRFDLESKEPHGMVSNLWITYLCGSISPANEKPKQIRRCHKLTQTNMQLGNRERMHLGFSLDFAKGKTPKTQPWIL